MGKDYDVIGAFQVIEEELIDSMLRNYKKHRAWERDEGFNWEMWQAKQLKSLQAYRNRNKKHFKPYFSTINEKVEEMLIKSYTAGNMDQEAKILEAIKRGYKPPRRRSEYTDITGEFFKVNDRKLKALIKSTKEDMNKAETAVLRKANDEYRKTIFNAQVYANTGSGTYEKAVDMATKDFLSKGINCIEYKNGARVNIVDYVSMAIQTASKRAYLQGEGSKRQEWGISTVIVASRGGGCPLCIPFQGRIFIDDVWSGGSSKDGGYPLLSSAISAGLYHPRCKDTHTTYFEGITSEPTPPTKAERSKMLELYTLGQKIKYAERLTRKYDNLQKGSLDEENMGKYKNKKQEWKQVNRSLKTKLRSDDREYKLDYSHKKSNISWDKFLNIDKNISDTLNEMHTDLNSFMLYNKKEQLKLLSISNNKVLGEQVGKIDTISLSKEIISKLKNGKNNDIIFLHNHPSTTTFSKEDIRKIVDFKSVRALTLECSDGSKYILQRGNLKSSMLNKMGFDFKYDDIYNKVARKYPELDDEVKIYDVWDDFLNDVNKEVSNSYGMIYERVK